MHEKFREAWKAAGYIASGLSSEFPNSNMEVSFHFRDTIQETVCPVKEVGLVIERYCRRFPMATVYYHGMEAEGFLAQLRCHCGHEKSKGCCREGNHHRAKILVTLAPAEKSAEMKTGDS